VSYLVEEIRLDHEYRPNLSGLAALTGVEIGQVEPSPPDPHDDLVEAFAGEGVELLQLFRQRLLPPGTPCGAL